MNSIREIYKIGHGPSSSHTMGPAKASEIFKNKYPDADLYKVELFGSLALTGKGHLTDKAIINELLPVKTEIIFNFDILYEYHSNAIKFYAYKDNQQIGEWLIFSVGGGELREMNQKLESSSQVYKEQSMGEIIKVCKENKLSLVDYCIQNEGPEIKDYLKTVLQQMEKTTLEGINKEGILPGKLLEE